MSDIENITPSRRRSRTCFSKSQLENLEMVFNQTQYPDTYVREKLSKNTELTETCIQIWFKNRRAKHRRSDKSLNGSSQLQHPFHHNVCVRPYNSLENSPAKNYSHSNHSSGSASSDYVQSFCPNFSYPNPYLINTYLNGNYQTVIPQNMFNQFHRPMPYGAAPNHGIINPVLMDPNCSNGSSLIDYQMYAASPYNCGGSFESDPNKSYISLKD